MSRKYTLGISKRISYTKKMYRIESMDRKSFRNFGNEYVSIQFFSKADLPFWYYLFWHILVECTCHMAVYKVIMSYNALIWPTQQFFISYESLDFKIVIQTKTRMLISHFLNGDYKRRIIASYNFFSKLQITWPKSEFKAVVLLTQSSLL